MGTMVEDKEERNNDHHEWIGIVFSI